MERTVTRMNLEKLFETQKVLRDRINYQGEDRFNKLVLALLVELGECANEWRGFKFWSKDQEPRYFVPNPNDVCEECDGQPIFYEGNDSAKKIIGQCDNCDGCGVHFHNPLLEEYVDGLHFVLEIGIEIGIEKFTPSKLISFSNDVNEKFRSIYRLVSQLTHTMLLLNDGDYRTLLNNYLHLGESLGFTWGEIEQAYYDKNSINHKRQDEGY
jgi:dimeric dUTPase (all-alpha-NTP-PPase superfamily)